MAVVTMQDILDALERLAERVTIFPTSRLDPFVSRSIRRTMENLRQYVPGLDLPPDSAAADFLARSAYSALEDGDDREAMARALRGLSFAPHHPGLWFVVASAAFEFGEIEDTILCLRHVLWIHPGHTAARRDLRALRRYIQERWPERPLADDLMTDLDGPVNSRYVETGEGDDDFDYTEFEGEGNED